MAKLKEDDEKQQSKAAEFREHKIDMLAKAGEIGGIMKFILQNRGRDVPEDVVLKLRDKHPSPLQELSDQEKQGIIHVDITDSCRELLGITGTRLRTILRKRPELKRAGPDKLRYDQLQTLIGYGCEQAPDEDEFANLLADILELLITQLHNIHNMHTRLHNIHVIKVPHSPSGGLGLAVGRCQGTWGALSHPGCGFSFWKENEKIEFA